MMVAVCLVCDEILVSTHQHDFQQCECKQKSMIDGGGGRGSRYGGCVLDMVEIIHG